MYILMSGQPEKPGLIKLVALTWEKKTTKDTIQLHHYHHHLHHHQQHHQQQLQQLHNQQSTVSTTAINNTSITT